MHYLNTTCLPGDHDNGFMATGTPGNTHLTVYIIYAFIYIYYIYIFYIYIYIYIHARHNHTN